MRRIAGVLLIVLALTSLSQAAVYFEDFDNYLLGSINGVNGWQTTGAHAVEPVMLGNVYNQGLKVAAATGTQGLFKAITSIVPGGVANDATGKLSYTFRFIVPANTTPNVSLGLSHLASNTIGTDYNSFKAQTRISRNGDTAGAALRLDFRNGATFSYNNAGQAIDIQTETWYQVWVDVDNSTDKYEVYVQGGSVIEKTKLTPAGGAFFRGASATAPFTGTLNSFITLGNTVPVYMDDLVFGNALERAHNPTPAHREVNIAATGVTLSFNGGENPAVPGQINPVVHSRYLYFTAGEPNRVDWTGVSAIKLTDTTDPFAYGPLTLERDKTYYWFIKEAVTPGQGAADPNALVGPVWRFETIKSIPVLRSNPQDTRVFAGEAAQFQMAFESLSTPSVTWKKYVDGVNDTTVAAGAPVFNAELGQYVSTLTVANVTLASYGQYYCVANNSSNQSQTSGMAWLGIKRLLAYYPFDGDATDAEGDNDGTLRSIDPNLAPVPGFVPGFKDGSQAIALNGAQQYVELSKTAYPKVGFDNGLVAGTIMGWINATKNGVILANADDNPTHFAVELHTTSNIRIIVRTASGTYETQGRPNTDFNLIGDGKWHFFAATWTQNGQMAMYIDGIQCSTITTGVFGAMQEWNYSVLFGAGRTAGNRILPNNFYGGAIDDVKIYNYYQTHEEIAQAYYDGTGISTCVSKAYAAYDFDNNCKVDLADFGLFVDQWLSCGLYPACQ